MKQFRYTIRLHYTGPCGPSAATVSYDSDNTLFRYAGATQLARDGYWLTEGYWIAPAAINGVEFVSCEDRTEQSNAAA